MTKAEAIEALEQGKKVKHTYFTADEFIYMKDRILRDEKNYRLRHFWRYRTEKIFDTGWSIFQVEE